MKTNSRSINHYLGKLILSIGILFISMQLSAKVTLPAFFTDNMVLQQNSEVLFWGKTTSSQVKVTTSWDKNTYTAKATRDGSWSIKVKTPTASLVPFEVKISDGKAVTLKNVLIGEVWICSGQSNMEMPLAGWGKVKDYEQEISNADYPYIRLLHIAKTTGNQPVDSIKLQNGGWKECSSASIPEFSSVAYFFGRSLFKDLNVPIGLINTSWGGTLAEAWVSAGSLESMLDYANAVNEIKNNTKPTVTELNSPNRSTVLFNAMIYPLIKFPVRGAIWYQGEANADTWKSYQYRELFPLLIADWRKQWNENMPFYFVQLANFRDVNQEPEESTWAELREAQAKTLNLENTGMAVTIDIGEAKDIHPKNKQEVGRRLSLIARANTYGEKIDFSGPVYESYKVEGNKVRISFKYSEGLKTKDGQQLKGFAIAGLDHKFHWAEATIDGNEVVVSCPEVNFPVAVRYAWANNPVCNLCNSANLPASPFRTDDWPGLTYGKK